MDGHEGSNDPNSCAGEKRSTDAAAQDRDGSHAGSAKRVNSTRTDDSAASTRSEADEDSKHAAALGVSGDDEQRKLEAKRAYNRVNAARARQRVKDQIAVLSQDCDQLTQRNIILEKSNQDLRSRVATLTEENAILRQYLLGRDSLPLDATQRVPHGADGNLLLANNLGPSPPLNALQHHSLLQSLSQSQASDQVRLALASQGVLQQQQSVDVGLTSQPVTSHATSIQLLMDRLSAEQSQVSGIASLTPIQQLERARQIALQRQLSGVSEVILAQHLLGTQPGSSVHLDEKEDDTRSLLAALLRRNLDSSDARRRGDST